MKMALDLSRHLERLMDLAPAGFAVALHIRFTTPTYMFQTYPPAWIEEYTRSGFLMTDPSLTWNFSNQGAIAWSELESLDQAGVLARAAAHGLRHGQAVSHLHGGTRSVAGFARGDRPFVPDEVEELKERMSALHEETASGTPLPRDVEVEIRRLGIDVTYQ
jgi:LuxR family transcriptional regulator